jgi:hypothetical protein
MLRVGRGSVRTEGRRVSLGSGGAVIIHRMESD